MKDKLIKHLETHGKGDYSYVELYDLFPFKGNLTRKQKSDSVRSLWKKIKKQADFYDYPIIDSHLLNEKPDGLYMVLGCVHAPFVNLPFWKAMLKMAEERKDDIKGIVLAGDFLDLHSLSHYDKGKLAIPGLTLGNEYTESYKYLKSILEILSPNIYKGFIYGNHCFRYNKYMSDINNSKLGSALPSPESALKLRELGFDIYTNWVEDEIQLGNLSIIHGEICTVTPAKKHIDTFKRNFLFFHTHRVSSYREGNFKAYNCGSMADFTAPVFNYATKAQKATWTNAFAMCTLHNGVTNVDTCVWENDHFTYGGKVYK